MRKRKVVTCLVFPIHRKMDNLAMLCGINTVHKETNGTRASSPFLLRPPHTTLSLRLWWVQGTKVTLDWMTLNCLMERVHQLVRSYSKTY